MVRHGRRAAGIAALCALIAALTAPAAFGAREEGDAGELPTSSQRLGPPGGMAEISGTISTSLDRDVYEICLTSGPLFSATTLGTGTQFDTQLFLLNANGQGVYANDDLGSPTGPSTLPAGHGESPTEDGVHYLAISHFNWDPFGQTGVIFPDRAGVTGPVESRATESMSGWIDAEADSGGQSPVTPGGPYRIFLTGVESCIPPDTTAPVINLRAPAPNATYTRGQVVNADYECVEEEGGSGIDYCHGPLQSGQPIDTRTTGTKSFTVETADVEGNERRLTHTYTVVEPVPSLGFQGFRRPLVNPPAVNTARAGSTVVLKFTLNRARRREVFAPGYPRSAAVPCDPVQDAGPGEAARGLHLRFPYKRDRDFHFYLWRTERRWKGSCRQFVLKLSDGSVHRANFRFSGRPPRPPRPDKPGKPGHDHDDDDHDDDDDRHDDD